jgi:L-seryl-tRNA(Ser) seleniumtransferase
MSSYQELGLQPIINAAGTLTTLGGSLMPAQVVEAMAGASHAFVDMGELHLAAGQRIAELTGAEAAHVCAGAAAGIVLMAAACMAGTDAKRIRLLPDTNEMNRTFIVQQGHITSYEQGIRSAGGKLVEIEPTAEALAQAVQDDDVAAIFYTFAWFCRQKVLPLSEVAQIAHQHDVPVIVDAAAEVPPVENLWRFTKEGADLVTFSGGKAMRGPQSTGIILGRADLIEACRLNDCPHSAIGRPIKVCKEEIVGLVTAVELYVEADHNSESLIWDRRVARVIETLEGLDSVQVKRQLPYGIGQQIPHAALSWDQKAIDLSYQDLVRQLKAGTPRIAVQLVTPFSEDDSFERTEIRIHPHTLREGEEVVVAERIRQLLSD